MFFDGQILVFFPRACREKKPNLSLGATRGKGQSPATLKENPGLQTLPGKENPVSLDLTGNLWDQRTR